VADAGPAGVALEGLAKIGDTGRGEMGLVYPWLIEPKELQHT
jgi:hypothetical protein